MLLPHAKGEDRRCWSGTPSKNRGKKRNSCVRWLVVVVVVGGVRWVGLHDFYNQQPGYLRQSTMATRMRWMPARPTSYVAAMRHSR